MKEKIRARTLWSLAALTMGYALLNVIVFFLTGNFGWPWFITSLIVYGVFLAGAIGLALVDNGLVMAASPAAAETVPAAVAKPEPQAAASIPRIRGTARTVVFRTPTGHLSKVLTLGNGRGQVHYFAFTPGLELTEGQYKGRVDQLDLSPHVSDIASEVDAALAERSSRGPTRPQKNIAIEVTK